MCSVPKAVSSPTSANCAILQAGIDNKEGHQTATKAIKSNDYMDDFAKVVAIVEETIQVYKIVRNTPKLGGFILLKWICNDDLVIGNIPEGDRSDPHTSSLLGMRWNVDDDTVCRGADKEVPKKIIQWVVLSFVASMFDPLGLFAPFTMRMRILLKTIWAKCGLQWDEKIEAEDKHKFLDWVKELAELKDIPLKRR